MTTIIIPKYDYLMKVILVGESGVGKSTMLNVFCDKYYNDNYISTIGVDFKIKIIDINGKKIKLQIWDTAGQERFRSIVKNYYKNVHAIMLIFDLTNIQSFYKLDDWLKEIKEHVQHPNYKILLVGTKCEISSYNKIPEDKIKEYANKRNLDYILVSSKKNINMDKAFDMVVQNVLNNTKLFKKSNTMDLEKNKKKDKCCS